MNSLKRFFLWVGVFTLPLVAIWAWLNIEESKKQDPNCIEYFLPCAPAPSVLHYEWLVVSIVFVVGAVSIFIYLLKTEYSKKGS